MKTLRGIFLFELLPVLVVMAGAAAAYHFYGERSARDEARRHLYAAAQVTAELVQREIDPLADTLGQLLSQAEVGRYLRAERGGRWDRAEESRQEIQQSLEGLAAENPRIESISLCTLDGICFANFPAESAKPYEDRLAESDWFTTTLEQQRYLEFEPDGRLRLARTGSSNDRSVSPAVACMVYDFRSTLDEASRFATRHLNDVRVTVEMPRPNGNVKHGEMPVDATVLTPDVVSLEKLNSFVRIEQSEAAALARFRAAERTLLIPLTIVTVGLLLVALIGTQAIIRDLREAQRKTEEASAAKGEFLASMSHEIRTPMNGILGMLELLETARLKSEEREYLEMASESARSLLRLINDILDFSKIEAGRLELDEAPFDVRDLVVGTLHPLSVRASEKGLRLRVQVDDNVPRRLVGDAGRLRQILVNLIGNAIKFTTVGEIEVAVRCDEPACEQLPAPKVKASDSGVFRAAKPVEDHRAQLHFSVRDTGIGIPHDKQQLIFEAFSQAERSTSRRFGGTGLGLAIASELASMMDGRLWLESETGCGSTFHFTAKLDECRTGVPVGDATDKATKKSSIDGPVAPEQRAHVLLVEDGRINQRVAVSLLERRGHSVVIAENGRQALEALATEEFDLILMDVEMPEMDGLEATRLIRDKEADTDEHIPIIAMTAHAIKGDRERFLEAGMDDYLAKPVNSRTLYAVVEDYSAVRCGSRHSSLDADSDATDSQCTSP